MKSKNYTATYFLNFFISVVNLSKTWKCFQLCAVILFHSLYLRIYHFCFVQKLKILPLHQVISWFWYLLLQVSCSPLPIQEESDLPTTPQLESEDNQTSTTPRVSVDMTAAQQQLMVSAGHKNGATSPSGESSSSSGRWVWTPSCHRRLMWTHCTK